MVGNCDIGANEWIKSVCRIFNVSRVWGRLSKGIRNGSEEYSAPFLWNLKITWAHTICAQFLKSSFSHPSLCWGSSTIKKKKNVIMHIHRDYRNGDLQIELSLLPSYSYISKLGSYVSSKCFGYLEAKHP